MVHSLQDSREAGTKIVVELMMAILGLFWDYFDTMFCILSKSGGTELCGQVGALMMPTTSQSSG